MGFLLVQVQESKITSMSLLRLLLHNIRAELMLWQFFFLLLDFSTCILR
jgi:hypothetical protein